MFWKKPPPNIVGGSWDVYSYTYGDNMRAVISFDVSLAQEEQHEGYNHSARVIVYIPLENVQENGLPMREALPGLDQVEDELIKALQKKKVDCRFAGRMSYGGMRELVFQATDGEAFKKCVQGTINNTKAYRIELREEAGWRFFDKKIKPAPVFWQQISDRKVIEQLRAAGSNPSALHLLDHTFIGAPQKLAGVKQALEADGFQETYSSDDTLVMSKQSRLDLDEIFGVTGRLLLYSADIGVQYDGWGAAVES